MYTLLITPEELTKHRTDDNWVIVDCRFSLADTEAGRKAYQQAHIPGAWYAHLDEQLSGKVIPGKTGRHPLPEVTALEALFSAWGIGAPTQVVAYDDMGGAMAARLWWLLRWLGHTAVAVLDGGYPAWVARGLPVDTTVPAPHSSAFQAHPQPDNWVDSDRVVAAIGQSDQLIVDSRAPERYRGEVEPIDPVAGHIPGAANLPHFSNVGVDGCFLPADTLRKKMETLLAGRQPEQAIFYCGSGVTAAHNVLAMEIAGLSGAKIYAGSWSEWITNSAHPVEQGA